MLRHRGPDGSGEWSDPEKGVFLGHRRLRIIDLSSASDQPMVCGDTIICYNGEVYNFRDLRQRLEGFGDRFESGGDVEVLLKAWVRFGEDSLEELDGMFAFAIWDGETAKLVVDPFGEKQLYYAETIEGIYVSSELLPLVRLLKPDVEFSGDCLISYMALGYIEAPNTVYPSIKKVPPASIVSIKEGAIVRTYKYWMPPDHDIKPGPPVELSEAELDQVHEVLVQSVTSRLEADVPACIFLSSGVDSVLVASIIAKEVQRSVDSITVSFPRGRIHNEAGDAAQIAKHLGLNHRVIENDDRNEVSGGDYLFSMYGQPNDNISIASVNQISSSAAAQGYSVAITGIGGDELSFGYQKHQFAFENRRLFGMPESLRRGFGLLAYPFGRFNSQIGVYQFTLNVRDCDRYLAIKNLPAIHEFLKIPGYSAWSKLRFGKNLRALEYEIPRFDVVSTLPNSQLVALDLGSMKESIELRTPYLSRRLFDVVASLDPRSLMAFGRKSLLKRLLSRYIPANFLEGPKRGFVFPQDRFIEKFSGKMPTVIGVPPVFSRNVWERRAEPGWRRLAVRTIVASEFPNWRQCQLNSVD